MTLYDKLKDKSPLYDTEFKEIASFAIDSLKNKKYVGDLKIIEATSIMELYSPEKFNLLKLYDLFK